MSNKPKILLLLPPAFLYPMGAACVAATLENAEYDYDIYGFFYDNRAWFKRNRIDMDKICKGGAVRNISAPVSQDVFFELIAKEKYDYLLVGGLVGFFRWFYGILPQVKGYNPNCKIIMGGGITKDLPENTILEKLDLNYILKGEAETNLIALLNVLSQENPKLCDLIKIPGLCWKDGASTIRKNATVRFDIEKNVVIPAWDSFNIEEYISLSDTLLHFNMTFFPILMGRGCPNVCGFCSPSIGRFTPCSVDNVISEMKYWVEKYNFDLFFIYSEVAFVDESYTQDFCHKYIKEIGKPWVGQIRTDVNFSADTYRLMKDAGCIFMGMGFESSNDRVLKIMKKRATFSDHLRNLTRAKEAGLNVFGNFMFGHETETADEIKETFNFINQYDLIQGPANGLAAIIIYPGTSYYRTAEENGLIDDPFKFLLSYSLKAGISAVDVREKHAAARLNISALSDDEFYDVVCTENIKHRRIYSERHAARDVTRTFEFDSEPGFVFEGKCPTCGNPVKFDPKAYLNPLNITKNCDVCYFTVVHNIYQFSDTEKYLEDVKEHIKQSNKIVIYGSWIMDLIYCGALSIPYEKIIAWVDPENPEISNYKYFYHMPQLSLEKLKEHEYDAVITLKPRVLSTPRIIEKYGLNPQCKTINLLPDILNTDIAKALRDKKIAIAGITEAVQKVKELLEVENSAGRIDHFSDVSEICNEKSKYDFVVFDKNECGIDRKEFAQNSRYRINEIFHVEFLYDGGFYTRC